MQTTIISATLGLLGLATIAGPSQAADFQQYLQGNCAATICTVDFDKVPDGKTLRVAMASCYVRAEAPHSNPYGVLHAVQLLLVKSGGAIGMAETLPAELTTYEETPAGSRTIHQSNEPVQVTAKGGQRIRAYVELREGTFEQVACHISGKLS
jgi:hypothetical protein